MQSVSCFFDLKSRIVVYMSFDDIVWKIHFHDYLCHRKIGGMVINMNKNSKQLVCRLLTIFCINFQLLHEKF